MFPCFLPRLCLDLYVSMLYTLSMLRSPCHAYAQIYMFMCSLLCLCLDLYAYVLFAMPLCLDLHVGCYALCFLDFLSLAMPFLVFWPLGKVQIQILWSRPTSVNLGLHQSVWIISFMLVFSCLLLCFISMYVCLDIGYRFCHPLFPLWACAC